VCRPQPLAFSIPQRAIGPNCRAHATSARCPSPETLKCPLATTPPRASTTAAINVRLCGSTPTTLPARSGVINTCDGPGPLLLPARIARPPRLPALPSRPRAGRQHPGGRKSLANAPIKSGRSSKTRTGVDTSLPKTPRQRARAPASQIRPPVQPSTLREPSPASGTTDYNTGIIRAGGGGHGGTCQVLLRPLPPEQRSVSRGRDRSGRARSGSIMGDRGARRSCWPAPARGPPAPLTSPAVRGTDPAPHPARRSPTHAPHRVDEPMWPTLRPRTRPKPPTGDGHAARAPRAPCETAAFAAPQATPASGHPV
jgi:hypothetical protein